MPKAIERRRKRVRAVSKVVPLVLVAAPARRRSRGKKNPDPPPHAVRNIRRWGVTDGFRKNGQHDRFSRTVFAHRGHF